MIGFSICSIYTALLLQKHQELGGPTTFEDKRKKVEKGKRVYRIKQ